MTQPRRKPAPVVVTWVPTVACAVCRTRVAVTGGNAGEALTGHYQREHAALLGREDKP